MSLEIIGLRAGLVWRDRAEKRAVKSRYHLLAAACWLGIGAFTLTAGCKHDRGGGSGKSSKESLAIEVLAPRSGDRIAGDVKLELVLTDPEQTPVDLEVYYTNDILPGDIDGEGAWYRDHAKKATIISWDPAAPIRLWASPQGSNRRLIWDSSSDTQDGKIWPDHRPSASEKTMLHLRFRRIDASVPGEWIHIGPFLLDQRCMATAAGSIDRGSSGEKTEIHPHGIGVSPDGSFTVADREGQRILRISPEGIFTRIIGTPEEGFLEGSPAIQSGVQFPESIALAPDGTLYFSGDRLVGEITPDGILREMLQNFPYFRQADIAVGPKGSRYIADTYNHCIWKVSRKGYLSPFAGSTPYLLTPSGFGGDGGPAGKATLNHPECIAVGADGSIYIGDSWNHRIRKVSSKGFISTIAGTGEKGYAGDGGPASEALLYYPSDLAVAPDGSLYMTDSENHCVRKISPDGIISTIAGNGIAGDGGNCGPVNRSMLDDPRGIDIGPDGSLYVADAGNTCIRKISPDGKYSTIWRDGYRADGGPAALAQLFRPEGIDTDGEGWLYIADTKNHCIRAISPDGIISTYAGTGKSGYGGDGGSSVEAKLRFPSAVTVDPDGSFFIADTGNHCIRKVSPEGIISTFAGQRSIFFSGYDGDGGPAVKAKLRLPSAVAIGPDGSIFIADAGNHCIRKVSTDGIISTFAGTGKSGYSGDGGPAADAEMSWPSAVAIGPDGAVIIADIGNHCIRKVSPEGNMSTFAGTGKSGFSGEGGPAADAELSSPRAVALGPDGSIFIADTGNHRLRRVTPDGIISTVAGDGSPESNGDGRIATESNLDEPCGVAIGPEGYVYIVDRGSSTVRRFYPNP